MNLLCGNTMNAFRWSRWWAAAAFFALMLCASCSSVGIAAEGHPAGDRRVGRSIRITLPITGQGIDRIEQFARRAIEKARGEGGQPVLILEFEVPPDQVEHARGSDFGAALSLAEFLTSDEFNGVRTVAYVPQSIRGHALLVVLACDEMIMGKDATLGPASGGQEVITEAHRGNYRDIANRRKSIPVELALWLLDPSRQVLVVETLVGRDYIAQSDLKQWEKEHTIKSSRKLYDAQNPGQSVVQVPGQLSGEEARRLVPHFATYLAADRQDVAKALDLPPQSVEEDFSLTGSWRAVQANLKGPITADRVRQVEQMIEDAVRTRDVNFVCLWIDSQGGSLADSIQLANSLRRFNQNNVRTVAYVPVQARSDAALIALACRELVMLPRAELGGPGPHEFSKEELAFARGSVSDENGPWNSRSWSLPAAMIDRHLEVYRCTRPPNELGYFCQEELDQYQQKHPDAKPWQKGAQVTMPGQQLLLVGQRAVEYRLADRTVGDFAGLRRYYGLERDPFLLEPGWANHLIEALASPTVAAFLLMVGFVALYIELHSPGIGLGGFVAALCFVLFFWSHYLAGQPEWLEILLFVAGLGCLLLEFFVFPGYAVFGLGGGLLVLISLILTSQTTREWPQNPYQFAELQRSLLMIAGAGAGFVVIAILLRKWLPHAPVVSEVFLAPPSGEEAQTISRREALVDFRDLRGARGIATTQLTPSGKARFGDRLVDVITDGDVIPRGTNIEVVEILGNRVIVRAAE